MWGEGDCEGGWCIVYGLEEFGRGILPEVGKFLGAILAKRSRVELAGGGVLGRDVAERSEADRSVAVRFGVVWGGAKRFDPASCEAEQIEVERCNSALCARKRSGETRLFLRGSEAVRLGVLCA